MAKTWTKIEIQNFLATTDAAGVGRALKLIYARQTDDEKATGDTKHSNSRGFNGSDAHYGSYAARWVLGGRSLNGKHLDKARKMLMKYCGQLAEEANKKVERAVAA